MTRTFAEPAELMIALLQGEKWELNGVVCEYDKTKKAGFGFRANSLPINSQCVTDWSLCDGKTLWHKVEEKTELDLMKEKYASGDYICIFKNIDITANLWYIENNPEWISSNHYKLIHKKHKDILEAYLVDNNVEIEYVQGIQVGTGFKDWTTDKCFIEDYLENAEYHIKPEIWIKTTTISLAMYTCYDARSTCWINPIICETMEECKIKLDESYFSLHTEIPNTRFETTSDKDRFEQNKWNTKLTDLTL